MTRYKMLQLAWWSALILLCATGTAVWLKANESPENSHDNYAQFKIEGENSFAIVELFTSEGCSSCPPAEDLLNELAREARRTDRPIYALAFHVDYWNHLGWTDPFSDRAYSLRQAEYVKALGARTIYTPQMVVNGQTEFVGSNRQTAQRAIQKALSKNSPYKIELKVERKADIANVSFSINEIPNNAVLNLAVVESGISTDVRRGENAGRTLSHENVVRVFDTVPLSDKAVKGKQLKLPDDLNVEQASIIAYLQKRKDKEILAAARANLCDVPW